MAPPAADVYHVDVAHYEPIISKIIDGCSEHSEAYQRLEHLCLHYGNRLSGSQQLVGAIEWLYKMMQDDGFDVVEKQPVQCPNWHAGKSHAAILRHPDSRATTTASQQPTPTNTHKVDCQYHDDISDTDTFRKMNIVALGGSISGSFTAEVVVIDSYAQCDELGKAGKLKGKIVLWNIVFTTYGKCSHFRWSGGEKVQSYGALASMIRSLASESLATPHTGTMAPNCKIPAVACTVEDAELIARLVQHGEKVVVHLCTENEHKEDTTHYNVVAEYRGREKPNEVVVIGGHTDSWFNTQGAHDDGQGVINSIEAVRMLKTLGLQPRRTIRVVCWVDEEHHSTGNAEYLRKHKADMDKHVAAIETDMGCYQAVGFGFAGHEKAQPAVQQMLSLLEPLGASTLGDDGHGVDIDPLIHEGVPGFLLQLHEQWWVRDYFKYHHTEADSIDKIDPKYMLQNVQVLACWAYLLADVPFTLPRADPKEFKDTMEHQDEN